jgi:hypothetical protein
LVTRCSTILHGSTPLKDYLGNWTGDTFAFDLETARAINYYVEDAGHAATHFGAHPTPVLSRKLRS